MFELVTTYVVEPEYIAERLNAEWGLTDPSDSRYLIASDILEAVSDYQCFGSNCYIDVSFDEDSIKWAVQDIEYYNNHTIDAPPEVGTNLRVRIWLRDHIPQPHTKCMLKVDY